MKAYLKWRIVRKLAEDELVLVQLKVKDISLESKKKFILKKTVLFWKI